MTPLKIVILLSPADVAALAASNRRSKIIVGIGVAAVVAVAVLVKLGVL